MADQSEQTSNIYALLIGIDGYQPNRLYKNLKGAVRDINLVADYLLKTLKIPAEKIFKLTSVKQSKPKIKNPLMKILWRSFMPLQK